jgi:hypothetical protein
MQQVSRRFRQNLRLLTSGALFGLIYIITLDRRLARHAWQVAKDNCPRETSEEADSSHQSPRENTNTILQRRPPSITSSRSPCTNIPLIDSVVSVAESVASKMLKNDYDSRVTRRLHVRCLTHEVEDTNDASSSLSKFWDNVSRDTTDASTLEGEGCNNATLDGDEESWIVEDTLSMTPSSVRVFIKGLDGARRNEHRKAEL